MKNQNRLKRVIAQRNLSKIEQKEWRLKLKDMTTLTGIESLCLDDEVLYVEYNPKEIDEDLINIELAKSGFHVKSLISTPVY